MYGRYYSNVGKITKISLNDEIVCSSRVIFVTVQTIGGNIDIQMVRELHPEFYREFDQLWEVVEKKGEEGLIGSEVKINQHNNYYQNQFYTTISLSSKNG